MFKTIVLSMIVALSLSGCNIIGSKIDAEKVSVNDSTKIYTYKDSGKNVTGKVILYEINPKNGKKYKSLVREVIDGKRINTGYNYFPSGSIGAEYPYDSNGQITGTSNVYYESGAVGETTEYKDGKKHGVSKKFDENGVQISEAIYENDIKIKEYEFDSNGQKIIPVIDKLELIEFKTGFYEEVDLFSTRVLYMPTIIMKLKNISDEPITESVYISATFIDNEKNEEFGEAVDLFNSSSYNPLQVGISRQSTLGSTVGYRSSWVIDEANISCQVYINEQLLKVVKIDNDLLLSNRLQ